MKTMKAISDLLHTLAKSAYETNERRMHKLFDIHESVQHFWRWDQSKFSDKEKEHIAHLENRVRSLLEEFKRDVLENSELKAWGKSELPPIK